MEDYSRMRSVCAQALATPVHSLSAGHINCQNSDFSYHFLSWTVRRVCVTWTNLSQSKYNEYQ